MQTFQEVADQFGIRLILQFGSSVTGSMHPRSDLDLAVMLKEGGSPLRTLSEIRQALQDVYPDQPVDLAIINRADPLFLKKLTDNCRLLFGAPADLARLRMYAFKRYQDHGRFLALEKQFVAKRLVELSAGREPA
jgi:predicted nucleotidyltransferase